MLRAMPKAAPLLLNWLKTSRTSSLTSTAPSPRTCPMSSRKAHGHMPAPFPDALATLNGWHGRRAHHHLLHEPNRRPPSEVTEAWLVQSTVFKYHGLLMGKPRGGNYHWIDNHVVRRDALCGQVHPIGQNDAGNRGLQGQRVHPGIQGQKRLQGQRVQKPLQDDGGRHLVEVPFFAAAWICACPP